MEVIQPPSDLELATETWQPPIEDDSGANWNLQSALQNIRFEVHSAIEAGKTIAKFSSLIAIAGLLNWCPRCGEWQGKGSEGKGPGVPSPEAPPVPARIIKALSTPIRSDPTPITELPNRDRNELKRSGAVLEGFGTYEGEPAKFRLRKPSNAHGRRQDIYHGGYPNPDSYPHAHDGVFNRGDGEDIPFFSREVDDTITYDSGVRVTFDTETNAYEWTFGQQQGDNT